MPNFILVHVLLFFFTAVFNVNPWPYILLSVAQLVYIPIMLWLLCKERDWFFRVYPYFAVPAYAAVVIEQITSSDWDILLAAIYLWFTLYIALYGIFRFLHRGFTNLEEFAIDIGLIYLAMGGVWYFAFIAEIDLGFSPLLTWLTAIHFHYSAFLLPVFSGLIGRLHTSRLYRSSTAALLVAPMVVAIGITFSRWIEVGSVLLYVYGLAGIILIAWKLPFSNSLQKWLIRISFTALAVTISFSVLYVLSNGFGLFSVTIDFMLRFHGVLNCVFFALLGIVGWSLAIPPSRFKPHSFPISQIRGRQFAEKIGDVGRYRGLSDDLSVYKLESVNLSAHIIDFYENTTDYRLRASVNWHAWFKPFAFLYSFISKRTQQINLPFSNKEVEMTGSIYTLYDGLDGRENVRAWERKVGNETIFTALYSQHQTNGRMYMNIALPLPFTTMTGILELCSAGEDLRLTSNRSEPSSDAGVYVSIGSEGLFKLPLQEDFLIQDVGNGYLKATHTMRIFALPFLTIEYSINRC
ncbi:YndJ family protein [Sporosarcina newyorkensis]|uniref:YndJ-like protein n=1 Tax=Sporosarcina newyorkensis TaxID=759851 RepID=A0A1T4XSE4_9BACL|nr:YndJ family protein [Sporosarcina newyorkensis]SKA92496.1 YndJ-like protein [Sporosarcina newyorkensis]